MVDRLVLHVGATKTGTSAIQSALTRDRAALLANGVYYPEDSSDEKAMAGRVTGGNGAIFRALYIEYQASPQRGLKKFEGRLRKLISANQAHTLLISHERASGLEPKLLSELRDIFSRHFNRVQVIFHVRHLTDHALSQYGEYIKRRGMKNSFDAFAPKYRARFKNTIENYESVFAADDIQYVLYEVVRDNLYRDFLQRVGLPSSFYHREPERVNRSLTPDELEVLRNVNGMRLSRSLVARIVEDFTFHNKRPKQRSMAVSRASIDAIARGNHDVIQCVNARLRGGAVLRVASDAIIEHACGADEAANRDLDPQIMRGFLESGLRVIERVKGKLDPEIVLAVRDSDSSLRDIEERQGGLDRQIMLSLLESGLRTIERRYKAPKNFIEAWKIRSVQVLKAALVRTEPAAALSERKRQKRLKRKKRKIPSAEASESRRQRRLRRELKRNKPGTRKARVTS